MSRGVHNISLLSSFRVILFLSFCREVLIRIAFFYFSTLFFYQVVVSNENDPQVGNRNHDIISKQRTQSPDRKDIQLKLKVPGQISNGQK